MRKSSIQFSQASWTDWHGHTQPVPVALQLVAQAFVRLQDERHAADYDNHEQWSAADVERLLNTANVAMDAWNAVRTEEIAGNYLLSMLIGKNR
jgi:hypothetical protein